MNTTNLDRSAPNISVLLTAQQAADYLGVHRCTLYRLAVVRRVIPYIRIGHKSVRFKKEWLDHYLEKRTVPALIDVE